MQNTLSVDSGTIGSNHTAFIEAQWSYLGVNGETIHLVGIPYTVFLVFLVASCRSLWCDFCLTLCIALSLGVDIYLLVLSQTSL